MPIPKKSFRDKMKNLEERESVADRKVIHLRGVYRYTRQAFLDMYKHDCRLIDPKTQRLYNEMNASESAFLDGIRDHARIEGEVDAFDQCKREGYFDFLPSSEEDEYAEYNPTSPVVTLELMQSWQEPIPRSPAASSQATQPIEDSDDENDKKDEDWTPKTKKAKTQ